MKKSPYISHTVSQIADALCGGVEVWFLCTGDDNKDDLLIGTEERCLQDVLADIGRDTLPADWLLVRVTSMSVPGGEIDV